MAGYLPFGILAATAAIHLSSLAQAGSVTWNFDIATQGQDVFWTSPTAADPTAPEYDYAYNVTQVLATVQFSIFPPTTVDVTGEIPPEYLAAGGSLFGPLPISLVDQDVLFPPPPEPIAIAGHLSTTLDAAAFGHVSFTDVVLGVYDVNLPPFGEVRVNIRGVRVVGAVTVTPLFAGDIDRDGDVDLADLAALLAAFGACAGQVEFASAADFDGSGCIELHDLAALLGNFGRD